MLTNVIDNQNKMIDILFEIISKIDKKEIKDDIYHKLLCVIDIALNGKIIYMNLGKKAVIMMNLI